MCSKKNTKSTNQAHWHDIQNVLCASSQKKKAIKNWMIAFESFDCIQFYMWIKRDGDVVIIF